MPHHDRVTQVKLYPTVPARRNATVARDLLVVALVLFFAWLGVRTYDVVDQLSVLGTGVVEAGTTVQNGFGSAANAVDGLPVIGDDLAAALAGAGQGTGGELAELGQAGVDNVRRLAWTLGMLVFLLPTVLLLVAVLPRRVRQVRALTAASVVLANPDDPRRRALLAQRAAFGLPYGTLLRYTRDPLGDLADERYDPLVQAALDDAGLRPRP